MRFLITFTICLTLFPFTGKGQRYHFEKITENDGLSDNRITCFLKDQSGFMWIGTENGLNRYDGNEFRIYRPGQKQYNLSHEHINDINQDAKGRLWVSTWSGLSVLQIDKDSLHIFSPDHDSYRQKKNKISSSLVWDTHMDGEKVWIALDARDLCLYDQRTDKFTYFPWQDFVKKNLRSITPSPYSAIQKIAKKSRDEIWLGTTRGLFSFNSRTSTFQFHGGDETQDFVSLYYDTIRYRVFFGQQKLYIYDENLNALKEIEKGKQQSSGTKRTILAPALSGLWEIDVASEKASLLTIPEKNPFSIHHQVVKAVYQDHDGTDWIGTSDGIRMHNTNLELFQFIPIFADTLSTTAGNIYHILDHQRDQRYYLSSYTKNKLIIIDKVGGDRKDITSIEGKPLNRCARTFEDSRQRLWVLTDNLIFISEDHKRFSVFPFPKEKDSYLFTDMIEDAGGNFWFASLRYGVYIYNPNKNSWKLLRHKPDGLFATRPTGLLLDPKHDALWIADFSFGVFRHDMKTKEFKYHGMDSNDPRFLQSSLATDLTIDGNGDVWVSTTSGGVSKYSQQEKIFTTYSMQTGLPENTIVAIEADQNGNLWLASHKGLTCIKPNGEIVKHFDQNNGLLFSTFSTPFSINEKGEMFIGIANGFLKFHPDSLIAVTPDFSVVITSAQVSGTPVENGTHSKFPYDQNEFTVQFSALTFSMPKKVTYYYQLKGFDKQWIDASNKHSAKYTNLDDGTYTFNVKAIDHAGKNSTNIASVRFVITAPFWKRWWFIGFIFVAAGTSLFLWIQSLQRKIHSQEILNQVATSLYNQSTYEEVFWTVTKNCIDLLHFEDCVVYLLDDHGMLIQKAAGGPKNKEPFQIYNPIEIQVGKGIVGSVAATGKPEIISDTRNDKRYIVDDQNRLSEISVPIIIEGKVFGVIDSEHRQKNFFTRWHLKMMQEIASICSAKISRYFVEDQIRSKVARDLHDDMGSSLSSINIMSKIALEKNEPIISRNYLRSIRENASLMQESLSDIVWAINPKNDTMEKVIIRMKEFAAEILEPLDIQYEFIEEGDFNHTKMDINTRKDFYLIFKEAINNAAKYSSCKKVVVHLSHLPHVLKLKIQDDGKGFDQSLNGSGNGLKNMTQRARTIQGELKIESAPGDGSSVFLIVPLN